MRILFCSIILLVVNISFAQSIFHYRIEPENPQLGQKVSLIVDTRLPSSDCWLVDFKNQSHCNSFLLEACYTSGMLTTICERTDTFALGILDYNSFTLQFNMWYSSNGDSTLCQNASITDSISYQYENMDSTNGFSIIEKMTDFEVYPNPCKGELKISNLQKASISRIILTFYDVYLKETKKVLLNAFNEEASVSLDNIDSGIYYLKIETPSGVVMKKVMIF